MVKTVLQSQTKLEATLPTLILSNAIPCCEKKIWTKCKNYHVNMLHVCL